MYFLEVEVKIVREVKYISRGFFFVWGIYLRKSDTRKFLFGLFESWDFFWGKVYIYY